MTTSAPAAPALPSDLLQRCFNFVDEQSAGEWGNDLVMKDAVKLQNFISVLFQESALAAPAPAEVAPMRSYQDRVREIRGQEPYAPLPPEEIERLTKKLALAEAASCNCLTKTPEIEWHAELCHYRLLRMARVALELSAAEIEAGRAGAERVRNGDIWRENVQNGWAALGMIREWLEERYVGVLPSQEAVLGLHGPEPVHEAEAIVAGLEKIAALRQAAQPAGRVELPSYEEVVEDAALIAHRRYPNEPRLDRRTERWFFVRGAEYAAGRYYATPPASGAVGDGENGR